MKRTPLNPWTFPEGMDQGLALDEVRRLVFVSGQCAVDAEGRSMHPGDMDAQVQAALDNVETVLRAAGLGLGDIVRMNTYVTDMSAFLEAAAEAMSVRLEAHDLRPPGVLAGVVELGRPDLLVEIEAIAAA